MAEASKDSNLPLLDSMVLLSVLSTAAEVRHTIEQRRIGHDPSEQEAEEYVRNYLHQACEELKEGFVRLYIQQVCGVEQGPVRHLDQSLLLQRLSRELHVVHQRLLSLYPAVEDEVVEQVRLLEQQASELLERASEHFNNEQKVVGFADKGLQWVRRLEQVL